MGENHREPGAVAEESTTPDTDRRNFLRKSLGAIPVVWTLGNRSGWRGTSMHGTLWSSTGTEWKHRGRKWWRGRGWEERPTPPPWKGGTSSEHRGRETEPPAKPGWDWDAPRDDWRRWRPGEEEEDSRPTWQWRKSEGQSGPSVEPVTPIEETINRKKE